MAAGSNGQRIVARPRDRMKLIVFGRYPEPGKVKTRLGRNVGPLRAAELHRRMAEQTVEMAKSMGSRADVEVRFTGGDRRRMRRWLGEGVELSEQGDGDLGARMQWAFAQAFYEGYRRVVIIGTDCVTISGDDLRGAFDALADEPMTLGPSEDGGYWLIGLNRMARVFDGIEWGGPTVLAATRRKAAASGVTARLLATKNDVDEPDDLAASSLAAAADRPVISVIVPTADEASEVALAVHSAQADGTEVLVVDGGSTDGTAQRATDAGATVIMSPRGRAEQMNRGAVAASGRILLFLHADTRLPAGYAATVFDAMLDRRAVGGAFRFAVDCPRRGMRIIERLVRFRSERLGLPYGDQSLFVRRDAFELLSGYRDLAIAEDMDLVRRLKRLGRVGVLDTPATTSARRWEQAGMLAAALTNQVVAAGALLGLSPDRLRRVYDRRGKWC